MERDSIAAKYYETEYMQSMNIKIAQLEEREKIYRDIHDRAGHDIVGSLLILQSLDYQDELYKKAIEKLSSGMEKIRAIVHNTDQVISERKNLTDICPDIKVYGDISTIPIHIYKVLENVVMESITNSKKYGSNPVYELDITTRIVRFYTDNKIVNNKKTYGGTGINNLRSRAISVGGSLSVNISDTDFSLVCVMPIG